MVVGRQELKNYKELEMIQTKVRDVMGPLGRLWSVMEEVKKDHQGIFYRRHYPTG